MTFQITINEKGGQAKQLDFDKNEVTIGRIQGNDVVLPKGNISKRHSRIVVKDGKFIIIDMQSTNGTYVNGKKITTPQVIKATDKIYIGDFTLQLEPDNGAADAKAEADAFADVDDSKGGHGLIDENFDKEFDEPSEEPDDSAPGLALELGDPEPDDEDDELDLSGEPEPEKKSAPVVPMKAPRKGRSSASRGQASNRAKSSHRPAERQSGTILEPSGGPAPAMMPMAGGAVVSAAAEALERADALHKIHGQIVRDIDLPAVDPADLSSVRQEALGAAKMSAMRLAARLPGEDLDALAEDAAQAATELGPLQEYIADVGVHEIVVTHQRQICVDRNGQLELTETTVDSEAELIRTIRALAVLGGEDPADVPNLVDVRLRDGSRVIGAMPPIAFRGPTLTYRKSSREAFSLEDFVANNTLDERMQQFVDYCVRYRQGILVSVGPGIGASATLNALASLIPADERIVTIEEGVELHLGHQNVTALAPARGKLVDLIQYASALLPDRALIGTISGAGSFEALTAMGGPLEGGVVCYAAESPETAIDRLARVEVADKCASLSEARRVVASAIKIVLQEERFPDASRRITKVCEVTVEGDNVALEDIFVFEPEGTDEEGLITGSFRATGTIPQFLVDLQDQVDTSIFE